MRSSNPAPLVLVSGIVQSLGCGNPSSAPENSNLGPPVMWASPSEAKTKGARLWIFPPRRIVYAGECPAAS